MNYPRRGAFGRAIWWPFIGLGFVLALVLCIPIWPEIPTLQVRLGGTETQATAHKVSQCDMVTDAGDPLFLYRYTFTGPHGENYTVTRENVCSNAYEDSATLQIWYLPTDPTHFLTRDEVDPSYSTLITFGSLALTLLALTAGLLIFLVFKEVSRTRQNRRSDILS